MPKTKKVQEEVESGSEEEAPVKTKASKKEAKTKEAPKKEAKSSKKEAKAKESKKESKKVAAKKEDSDESDEEAAAEEEPETKEEEEKEEEEEEEEEKMVTKSAASKKEAPKASKESGTTVYLKGISFDATEEDVLAFFAEVGTPTLELQRGFGTATFESAEEAKAALGLTGGEVAGRKLWIHDTDGSDHSKGGSKFSVFVGNVCRETGTEEGIRDFFSECGDIIGCRLLTDRETGESKGCAFLDFSSKDAADAAVAKNGEELFGRSLKLDHGKDSGGGRGGRGGQRGGFRGGRGGDRGGRGGDRGGRGGRGGFRGGRGGRGGRPY